MTATPLPATFVSYAKQREDILAQKLETASECEKVRGFFLEALDTTSELYEHYHAYGWPIERDLMEKLRAFDQNYDLVEHDLKLLRRFLLKRYSFCYVFTVDDLLRARGTGWLWLAKDYIVPRVGLSLLVGFGVTLGAGRLFEGLGQIARNPWLAVALIAACLVLTGLLIYLMVRDRLSSKDAASGGRTAWIFFLALVWTLLELLAVFGMSKLVPWNFSFLHAASTGAVALVFAVLTQFFFSESGSMAEPL